MRGLHLEQQLVDQTERDSLNATKRNAQANAGEKLNRLFERELAAGAQYAERAMHSVVERSRVTLDERAARGAAMVVVRTSPDGGHV